MSNSPNDKPSGKKSIQGIKKLAPNLYQIHSHREIPSPSNTATPRTGALKESRILKAETLGKVTVSRYTPADLSPKKSPASKPSVKPSPTYQASSVTLENLRQNLNELNQLHSRLKFMLEELEEYIQE